MLPLAVGFRIFRRELILDTNNIDDEGAALLVYFLARSSEVSCVNIRGNPLIRIDGWRLFAGSLHPTSSSKLKVLIIGKKGRLSKEMIDNLIATFSHLLGGNTAIEVLKLCDYDKVTNAGWSALYNALCNKSSIADIYSSNHTFHTMEDVILRRNSVTDRLPFDILSLLRLNHNKNKGEVIRFKILKYFLSDAANVGPTFANVATTVIPNAIG